MRTRGVHSPEISGSIGIHCAKHSNPAHPRLQQFTCLHTRFDFRLLLNNIGLGGSSFGCELSGIFAEITNLRKCMGRTKKCILNFQNWTAGNWQLSLDHFLLEDDPTDRSSGLVMSRSGSQYQAMPCRCMHSILGLWG